MQFELLQRKALYKYIYVMITITINVSKRLDLQENLEKSVEC